MIVSLERLTRENLRRIEEATGEQVETVGRDGSEESLLPQADILIGVYIGADALGLCKKLRWLFVMSAGVDHLPLGELERMGVRVSNASGIHATQMAEQAMGYMIAFSRKLPECARNQRKKVWGRLPVDELYGKSLCIVGAGSIGRELARKAKAFDMHVTGLKRSAEELANFDEVRDMSRFHESIAQADYVALLTPLTDETYHLFGAAEFAAMKKSAVFVNMSRGDTVDEPAMIRALKSGEIAGAGLDVFHKEPLEPESELWEMENVIVTPHDAGIVPAYQDRAVRLFIESFKRFSAGEPLPNLVNLRLKY